MMGPYLAAIICIMAVILSLSVTVDSGGSVNTSYTVNTVTTAGKTVQFTCSYPDNHEHNEKFLCKGPEPLNCEKLIHTTEQDRHLFKDRLDIRDNKRIKYFSVHIKNVSIADSGTYWCGSDKTQTTYTNVILSVVNPAANMNLYEMSKGPTDDNDNSQINAAAKMNLRDSDSPTKDPPAGIIGGVLGGVVLLLTLVVVLILFRHKLHRMLVYCAAGGTSQQMTTAERNTEKDHGAHDYEEIRMPNQQASSGEALPTVYATINPPAYQLNYACVNFQNNPLSVPTGENALSGTNENGSPACDYSVCETQVATCPPAAEQTLYSVVTKPEEARGCPSFTR